MSWKRMLWTPPNHLVIETKKSYIKQDLLITIFIELNKKLKQLAIQTEHF